MDLNKIFIKNAKPTKVGGQAVLDGIMMKGESKTALVMRLPDHSLYGKVTRKAAPKSWTKVPIIRGVGIFGGALIEGVKTIMNSADILEKYDGENALEDDRFTRWMNKKFGKEKAWNILMYITVAFSLALSIGLFIIIPTALVSLGKLIWDNTIFLNIIEGIVRIIIFLIYILLVSKVKEIKDVFRYHGAEHKTIHCFESGEELTVENCRKFTTLHPRCGTSFLVFVLIISLILFSFLGWPNIFIRIASRLLLLPVIAGISYELLRWAGRSDSWLVKILSLPGIYLQKITTAEPTDQQLEVAIVALKAATKAKGPVGEGLCDSEGNIIKNVKALMTLGEKELVNRGIDEREAKAQSELLYCHLKGVSRGELFNFWKKEVTGSEIKRYNNYILRKASGEPLEYITGTQEFMGLEFIVNENVLIPRHDTEVVVLKAEELLRNMENNNLEEMNTEDLDVNGLEAEEVNPDNINENKLDKIRVLDLCCGSGAIGISINQRIGDDKIDLSLSDISEEALLVTGKNIRKHKIESCIIQSNLFENIQGDYSMIISNPPYIPTKEIEELMIEVRSHEPILALDGGDDGLHFYRKIIEQAAEYLQIGGALVFEVGHGQGIYVKDLMEKQGIYENLEVIYDLDNKERGVAAIRVR